MADEKKQYRIRVAKYMTKKATPEFDFMKKWNNNVPMPYLYMVGTKEKETRGMVYMKLRPDITAEHFITCIKCGRALKDPISQYYGIGPSCGNHAYRHPFKSKKDMEADVIRYKQKILKETWEGWVIKRAIYDEKEVKIE